MYSIKYCYLAGFLSFFSVWDPSFFASIKIFYAMSMQYYRKVFKYFCRKIWSILVVASKNLSWETQCGHYYWEQNWRKEKKNIILPYREMGLGRFLFFNAGGFFFPVKKNFFSIGTWCFSIILFVLVDVCCN